MVAGQSLRKESIRVVTTDTTIPWQPTARLCYVWNCINSDDLLRLRKAAYFWPIKPEWYKYKILWNFCSLLDLLMTIGCIVYISGTTLVKTS